jgi:hypothetical protein
MAVRDDVHPSILDTLNAPRPTEPVPLRDDGMPFFAPVDGGIATVFDLRRATAAEIAASGVEDLKDPRVVHARLARMVDGVARAIVFRIEDNRVLGLNTAGAGFLDRVWEHLVGRRFRVLEFGAA